MNQQQTLEIVAIVKKYLTLEKNGGFITLRVKNDDLNARLKPYLEQTKLKEAKCE
jgi:hypothetical protein